MAAPPTNRLRIGEALYRARTGQSMDVRAAEERTKIRAKYLRALESEDWEALPSPAYVRGFLRTYASLLGLDAHALVDEYRRQVESQMPDARPYGFGEPVLERRRRPGESEPGHRHGGAWLGLAIAAALAALLAVAISGGGGERQGRGARAHHQHPARREGAQQGPGGAGPSSHPAGQPVSLVLEARQGVQACLVNGAGQALIDDQALGPGARSGPFQPADRFRLDLESGGTVELTVNGRREIARAPRRASFVITSAGVHEVDFKGPRCP